MALITDGRFSGGRMVSSSAITPEAFEGGLIALVQDDDIIELDATANKINLKVADEVIAERQ